MTIQPSNFVALDWLMPLFNEQLSQLSDVWQNPTDATQIKDMAAQYHAISGALTMANMPHFAHLAQGLSQLADYLTRIQASDTQASDTQNSDTQASDTQNSSTQARQNHLYKNVASVATLTSIGSFANETLHKALNQFIAVGEVRYDLIDKCTAQIFETLPEQDKWAKPIDESSSLAHSTALSAFTDASVASMGIETTLSSQLNAPTPTLRHLSDTQLSQLLLGWRQVISQLLAHNQNQKSLIKPLQKISHYLWEGSATQSLQSLWYLAFIWLQNLENNTQPQPKQYAATLAHLEAVLLVMIQIRQEQDSADNAVANKNTNNDPQQGNEKSTVHPTANAAFIDKKLAVMTDGLTLESILADVCIRLSMLTTTDDAANQLLLPLNTLVSNEQEFLPRVLEQLEQVILNLGAGGTALESLIKIKRQLSQRGWVIYQAHINQIISDLEQSEQSQDMFMQLQWQIERQLQDLYMSILTTHDTIVEKIGSAGTNYAPNHQQLAEGSTTNSDLASLDSANTESLDGVGYQNQPTTIRQLRILVEDLKAAFNSYVQQNNSALLPDKTSFTKVAATFSDMGLQEVSVLIKQLAELFEPLKSATIHKISWKLTNEMAQSLASVELFLDYLAQQVFDKTVVNKLSEHITTSQNLLAMHLNNPNKVDLTEGLPAARNANLTNAPRYDDNGEVVLPSPDTSLVQDTGTDFDDNAFDDDAFDDDAFDVMQHQDDVPNDLTAPIDKPVDTPVTVAANLDDKDTSSIEIMPLASALGAVAMTQAEKTEATEQPLSKPSSVESSNDVSTPITSPQDRVSEDHVSEDHVSEDHAAEESEALIAARAELKPDNFDMDEEIREIFIEEAEEVLEQLNENLPLWQQSPQDFTPLAEIRRGFHTLKGSGRMVGAFNAGELAWAVENMLNRVLDKTLPVTDELISFITATKDLIPTLVNDFANKQPPSIDPAITVLKAKNLLAGKPIDDGLMTVKDKAQVDTNTDYNSVLLASNQPTDDELAVNQAAMDDNSSETITQVSDINSAEPMVSADSSVSDEVSSDAEPNKGHIASTDVPEVLVPFIAAAQDIPADADDADPDIKEIFIEEAEEVLTEITPIFQAYQSQMNDEAALTDVRRGFHTLKGSGRMVGANHSAELAWAIESMLNRVLDHTATPSEQMMQLVSDVLQAYPSLVEVFEAGSQDYPKQMPLWIACANAFSKNLGDGFDYPTLLAEFTQVADPKGSVVSGSASNSITTDSTATKNQAVEKNEEHVSEKTAAEQLDELAQLQDAVEQDVTKDDTLLSIHSINEKMAQSPVMPAPQDEDEQVFVEIFIEEARERLEDIRQFVTQHKDGEQVPVNDDIVRAFHTLRGASGSESLAAISDISATIEHSLEQLQHHDVLMNSQHLQALEQSVELIENHLSVYDNRLESSANTEADNPTDNLNLADSDEQNQQDFENIQALLDDPENEGFKDNELTVAQLISEGVDDLLDAEWELESRLSDHDLAKVSEYASIIASQIEQLMQSSASSKKFQALLMPLLAVYQRLVQNPTLGEDDIIIDTLLAAHGQLTGLFDALAGSMSLKVDKKVIDDLIAIDNRSITQSMGNTLEPSSLSMTSTDDNANLAINTATDEALKLQAAEETQEEAQDKNSQKVATSESVSHDEPVVNTDAVQEDIAQEDMAQENIAQEDMAQENIAQDSDKVQNLDDIESLTEIKAKEVAARQALAHAEQGSAKTAEALEFETIDTDEELLEIFLEEAQELDVDINKAFNTWRDEPEKIEALKALQRHLHTIKGGARMAGIRSIGDLTHEAETVYEYFVNDRLTPSVGWVKVMQGVQDTLSAQIEYVVKHHKSFFAHELVEAVKLLIEKGTISDDTKVPLPVLTEVESTNTGLVDVEANQKAAKSNNDEQMPSSIVQNHAYDELTAKSWGSNKADPEILEVFLEEAEELVASSSEYLQSFRSNTGDVAALQALQRDLHTMKGGARMVSANGIADLAHQMETVYEELASRRRPATKMVSQLLMACHDWLADAVFILKRRINPPIPHKLIKTLEQFSASPDSLQTIEPDSLKDELEVIADYDVQQQLLVRDHDISEVPPMDGGFERSDGSATSSNEVLRISADLIERMINLTGESAINRARIDMGMSSLTNSIEEMGTTVQRLADQLRRMDIELEAQILSQIDDDEMLANEEFDPLEMDQYSALNQLSKSLSESASDLLDIKSTLLDKTRDNESLLLQMSRTQAELQDGLMSSRMVPFARLTPRLQRIVRQTASELNKAVELTIVNSDDEMDRTILDRITSPLEHMLRNAVDHGIESPEERVAKGKPRTGEVKLEVMREGSEIVIHLTDDGSGINVEAVRKKAISQGLIDANDTSLTDVDVMQYIFNAGLTTTQQITQISGRGVGMDVVRSEIRQLGGTVSVDSSEGGGSRFTIRVPLTVAVSDALIVRAADRFYAIPLVQIERVVRVNPEVLYDYYQSGKATLKIGDADYRVRYLNEILTAHTLNELVVNTNVSLPVIIIKSQTGQRLAIQVDEISGSRIEVVVKPLGRQLSRISGISAATIMGDGSVMLILDLIALMRNAIVAPTSALKAANVDTPQVPELIDNDKPTTILVVDDSVTVRKVTSRFLERQGLEAVVAKDGVDAIEILQELTPDLILLDIEMPRMDGFEVATQVRHDTRLKTIPIIMITSRTGEKHRERAMEIGVNDYMGKPFQENELLTRIQSLLGAHVGNQND